MVLVTRQAPDFTSSAVLGNGEIAVSYTHLDVYKRQALPHSRIA